MSMTSFAGRLSRGLFLIVCACAVFAPPPAGAAVSAGIVRLASVPVAQTTSGAVVGTIVQNMQAYRGIPYAAPPVGPLRWQPPVPPAKWPGTLAATGFANHCPQGASPSGFASTTEDCLYLNVFAPVGTKAGAKLPVMVWLHGGAFVDGESDDYDPDRLVARGVIVVTLNYRLGYLGFLATTGLDAEPHAHVNYGLLDQQFALQWTRANIAAFGGDPARTTVFGQSAGGASVFAHLLSPGSTGLFSRAIIESGAYDILSLPTLASAQTAGDALAVAAHCLPRDTACLRSLTVHQILALQSASDGIASSTSGGPSPAVDGSVIPLDPETALSLGRFNRVPVVQGSNHDEFRFFTALLYDLAVPGGPQTPLLPAEYPYAVEQTLAAVGLEPFTTAVLASYPLFRYASPDLAYSALTTDAVFSTPAYLTDALLSARTPVYAYEFSDENAPEDFLPPVTFPYGAAHGSELQFLYDSFDRPAPPLSADEQRLAAAMVGYWAGFAAYGTPNAFGSAPWPPYAASADDMELFVAPHPNLFYGFAPEHKVAFWAALAAAAAVSHGVGAKKQYLTLDAAIIAQRQLSRRQSR